MFNRRRLGLTTWVVAGLTCGAACQGPQRSATERAAADPRTPGAGGEVGSSFDASTGVSAVTSEAFDVACTVSRAAEFVSEHSRMPDVRVGLTPSGVYFGHGGPNVGSMLSKGEWDATETHLHSNSSEVFSASALVGSAQGELAVETFRGGGEGGYNYQLTLRATPVGVRAAAPDVEPAPMDVGVVAWDPRLVVAAAASSYDSRRAVLAHASVTDAQGLYVVRVDERGALDGYWSRAHGEELAVPWLEVVATPEGALVSAVYRGSESIAATWRLLDVTADGDEPNESSVTIELPAVKLAQEGRPSSAFVTVDGHGAVWRDDAGGAWVVRVGAGSRLTAQELALELPVDFAATSVRQNLGVVACSGGACQLSLFDSAGRQIHQSAPFDGNAPTIVASLGERLVTSHVTPNARIVREWLCR